MKINGQRVRCFFRKRMKHNSINERANNLHRLGTACFIGERRMQLLHFLAVVLSHIGMQQSRGLLRVR